MKNKKKEHLPIFGVGPIYAISIFLMTLLGIALSLFGFLDGGKVSHPFIISLFILIGVVLFVCGFLLWQAAMVGKNSIVGYIEKNMLYTAGVYSIVRNPCYSGIMLMCSGAIVVAHNLWLLVFPLVFWEEMTILIKNTEEKWLAELYGQEYLNYCKNVNRCIPCFPRSKGHNENI